MGVGCTGLSHSHLSPNTNHFADEQQEARSRETSRGSEINVKDRTWGHCRVETFEGSRLNCYPTSWTLKLLPVRDAVFLSVGDEFKDDFLASVQTSPAMPPGRRRQVQPMPTHNFVVAALTQQPIASVRLQFQRGRGAGLDRASDFDGRAGVGSREVRLSRGGKRNRKPHARAGQQENQS